MRHWWEKPDILQCVKSELGATLHARKYTEKQGGALFSALHEALTTATGAGPVYSGNCLWVWDGDFGVWSRVTHPKRRFRNCPTYADLWVMFDGLEVWKPNGENPAKSRFGRLRVGQTFELWMDGQPARSSDCATHDFFENATAGVICPTVMADATTTMRLWSPDGNRGLSHVAPEPNHRKRLYFYDPAVPMEAQEVPCDAGDGAPHAPEWLGYLRSLWGDDADCAGKIQGLEEFIGVSMLGVATKYQRMIIMEGEGGAGKSLLIEAVTKLCFQEEQVTSTAPAEWAGFAAPSLDGPLLNVVTEMPEGRTFRSDRFKSVISGDRITVARKNQNEYSMRPRAGHIIAANKLPEMSDPAVIRRLFVMQFNRTFVGDADRKTEGAILQELRGVAPRIRIRCLFAAGDLMRRADYALTDENRYCVAELVQRSSPVKDFIDTALQVAPKGVESEWRVLQSELYKAFRLFCHHSGVTSPPTTRNFYKDLEIYGLRREKLRPSNAKRRFLGVHLMPEGQWGFELDENPAENKEWRH